MYIDLHIIIQSTISFSISIEIPGSSRVIEEDRAALTSSPNWQLSAMHIRDLSCSATTSRWKTERVLAGLLNTLQMDSSGFLLQIIPDNRPHMKIRITDDAGRISEKNEWLH